MVRDAVNKINLNKYHHAWQSNYFERKNLKIVGLTLNKTPVLTGLEQLYSRHDTDDQKIKK
jgi:hypothetical protein